MTNITALNNLPPQRQYSDGRASISTYAPSGSTLAESPPSCLANQPPPYGFAYSESDTGSPPRYNEPNRASVAKEKPPAPWMKKKLIIRLMTSILITVIVCLIVAAVVGRIHDKQTGKDDADDAATPAVTATLSNAVDKFAHATRITMDDTSTAQSEPAPTMAPLTTFQTSVRKHIATPT